MSVFPSSVSVSRLVARNTIHLFPNSDPDSGAQPLTNEDESIVLAVNGEIYNHRLLRKQFAKPYPFKTHSDCEVIIPLVCQSEQYLWDQTNNKPI